MEAVMEALCKSGSLFEVAVPDYKQLKACHKEVRLLKELWDMIMMVRGPGRQVTGVEGREEAWGGEEVGAAWGCTWHQEGLPRGPPIVRTQ
jgi:hypothetical protein